MGRFEMRIDAETKELWETASGGAKLSVWARGVLNTAALGLSSSPEIPSESPEQPSPPFRAGLSRLCDAVIESLDACLLSSSDPNSDVARAMDIMSRPDPGPELHRGRVNDQTHEMFRAGRITRDIGPGDPGERGSVSSPPLGDRVPESVLMEGDPGGGLIGVEESPSPAFRGTAE